MKQKAFVKHISRDCKYKFNSAKCSWNPSTCISENIRYLKSIKGNLVIVCNEIINGSVSVPTSVANTISANVMSTVLISFDDKKVT